MQKNAASAGGMGWGLLFKRSSLLRLGAKCYLPTSIHRFGCLLIQPTVGHEAAQRFCPLLGLKTVARGVLNRGMYKIDAD